MKTPKRVIVDLDVQNWLCKTLSSSPDVQQCLIETFKQLGSEQLAYGPDIISPGHCAVDKCGFTILFSVKDNEIYITELFTPARNGLRGILGS